VRKLLAAWVRSIESDARLDGPGDRVAGVIDQVVPTGVVKDGLSGVWLGHALHPMLTDLPIGFWTSAMALDMFGGRGGRDHARRLVAFGLLSAVPAAAAGAADWSDTTDAPRRVGLVHAGANTAALALYFGSWRARRRGRHGWGIVLSFAGATAATVAGYLGGHLLETAGIGVDNTAFQRGPRDWTRVLDAAELGDAPVRVQAEDAALLVWREDAGIVALAATCPHRGARLDEGTIDGDAITCPWHGSRFARRDGELLRGPATNPLPRYDAREHRGGVEVRRPRAH
jgi:nitrite reductase/ring-hydroxylating ferredoxin subunit/uncharacterized membrane protein